MPMVPQKMDGLSYGRNDNWALEREMTGSVAVNVAKQQTTVKKSLFTKANRAGHSAGPREPKSKWDRGFYPFIDLSSFMQPFTPAR